jgi:hypothetical protein
VARRILMPANISGDVPEPIRADARARFEEIVDGLQGIAPDSPFWASVAISRLRLVVHGWCFTYAIDDETLRVTAVREQ